MDLQLLLRLWNRRPGPEMLQMVTLTLDKMAGGGIYDHLAGGFARYSVDERWLVPHFEKMLYDNALLTGAYLDAFQATKEQRFARTVRETCDYILRYMTDPAGGLSQHGRRRQRRRRREVLCLDARRNQKSAGRRSRRAILLRLRRDPGRQFRARPQHPQPAEDRSSSVRPSGAGTWTSCSGNWPTREPGCWRSATSGFALARTTRFW